MFSFSVSILLGPGVSIPNGLYIFVGVRPKTDLACGVELFGVMGPSSLICLLLVEDLNR